MAEVVGFEPTDPFEPSVFKTAALSHAQPYFLILVPRAGVEPASKFLFLRETTLPICLPGHKEKLQRKSYALEVEAMFLEQRVRFELTVLRICNPLHWATLPPLHYWYSERVSIPLLRLERAAF